MTNIAFYFCVADWLWLAHKLPRDARPISCHPLQWFWSTRPSGSETSRTKWRTSWRASAWRGRPWDSCWRRWDRNRKLGPKEKVKEKVCGGWRGVRRAELLHVGRECAAGSTTGEWREGERQAKKQRCGVGRRRRSSRRVGPITSEDIHRFITTQLVLQTLHFWVHYHYFIIIIFFYHDTLHLCLCTTCCEYAVFLPSADEGWAQSWVALYLNAERVTPCPCTNPCLMAQDKVWNEGHEATRKASHSSSHEHSVSND